MIPNNLTTYAKNGVTGVTDVTHGRGHAQQGFARNTSGDQLSHRHPGDISSPRVVVTPAGSSQGGVTKRCDAESVDHIDSPGYVTPATPVTPKKEYVADDWEGALLDPETRAPFWPWGPYIDSTTLKQWQRELFEVVDALAHLERWSEGDYDHVVMCIERQPLSTLRPDLIYFSERLSEARAEAAARNASNQRAWRFDR
ncbi:hypothetical protein QF000_006512 [Paraburkholderia atlantica]|uniref:hypothetical protein n=1 Tax=Paraburkholderia atlantica TaxID=2654982 RepID=UPI003D1CF707